MKIALLQSNPIAGDIENNTKEIVNFIKRNKNVDLFIAPELCLTGYPPEDLLLDNEFISRTAQAESMIHREIKKNAIIFGNVRKEKNRLFNSAIFINAKKKIYQNKISLPNYGVFDEKRYFQSGNKIITFKYKKNNICVLVCEDFWDKEVEKLYKNEKLDYLIIINSSPFELGKLKRRIDRAKELNNQLKTKLIYLNMAGGQDDVVFDGGSFVLNNQNIVITQLKHFKKEFKLIDFKKLNKPINKIPSSDPEMVLKALICATKDYVKKNNIKNVFLGLSGGIDSALVLYIASKSIKLQNIKAVMMRSKFTSPTSVKDAKKLAKNLNIQLIDLNLEPTIKIINKTLHPEFKNLPTGIAEENIQARARGLTLMALSNKLNGAVLTTSNKSETALGYSTLYGDMAGAFSVLKDVPKTLVYKIAELINKKNEIIPNNILIKAPTAELRENQTDQDNLPSYETIDKIIHLFIDLNYSAREIIKTGFKPKEVKKIVELIYANEFKRRQSPPGPKITLKAFGRDRRFPITNKYKVRYK
ncbi:MAG: NAD+ synthase [Nitrosomonadales bacterium]